MRYLVVFISLDQSNPDKNLIYGHHHPKFDFDEGVLPIAVASLLGMIEELGCLIHSIIGFINHIKSGLIV